VKERHRSSHTRPHSCGRFRAPIFVAMGPLGGWGGGIALFLDLWFLRDQYKNFDLFFRIGRRPRAMFLGVPNCCWGSSTNHAFMARRIAPEPTLPSIRQRMKQRYGFAPSRKNHAKRSRRCRGIRSEFQLAADRAQFPWDPARTYPAVQPPEFSCGYQAPMPV